MRVFTRLIHASGRVTELAPHWANSVSIAGHAGPVKVRAVTLADGAVELVNAEAPKPEPPMTELPKVKRRMVTAQPKMDVAKIRPAKRGHFTFGDDDSSKR